jgi:hypothetical protein
MLARAVHTAPLLARSLQAGRAPASCAGMTCGMLRRPFNVDISCTTLPLTPRRVQAGRAPGGPGHRGSGAGLLQGHGAAPAAPEELHRGRGPVCNQCRKGARCFDVFQYLPLVRGVWPGICIVHRVDAIDLSSWRRQRAFPCAMTGCVVRCKDECILW